MNNMMSGMDWMHTAGMIVGLLLLIALVLGIAALIKYLRRP